jgi:uncharacterized membrane protein YraQ (UPF0718 family)
MTSLFAALGHALWLAFAMLWEILWPLILGFGLSALVQAVVSKSEMTKLLPNDSPKSLAIACGLGAASSSCSYAAVALARSIFRKGADFTAAMAFELASTNLVAELTVIIIVLMGWEFAAAEFVGGPLMVVLMAFLFRIFLSRELVGEARAQANKGLKGKMEGHAEMDMSVTEGSFWQRITSKDALTATSHYFIMDWLAVWKDIVGGLLIAGALAAWVPKDLRNSSWYRINRRKVLGTNRGADRRRYFVCLFRRQHSAGCSALEWRHQLRRRHCIHLRRPDRAANHRHLPQVLWLESCRPHRFRFLCCHGPRCAVDRIPFPIARADSFSAQRRSRRYVDQLQLHDRLEHNFPGNWSASSRAIFQNRRAEDAGAHGLEYRVAKALAHDDCQS